MYQVEEKPALVEKSNNIQPRGILVINGVVAANVMYTYNININSILNAVQFHNIIRR